MSFSNRWSHRQSAAVLGILVVGACAVQTEEPDSVIEVPSAGGAGGSIAGMPAEVGGSMDAMLGGGGTMPMGGVMGMGSGGRGMAGGGGTAGKGMAGTTGKGGSSAGMPAAMAGKGGRGGGAGTNAMGGAGMTGSAGKAGASAGGRMGSGGMGMAGRGTAGTGAGGRGAAGGGGGTAGATGMKCVTSLMPNQASGNMGTTAVCFDVTGAMLGWQVSNLGKRTLTVNDKPPPAAPAVPAAVDGHRIFQFSAVPSGDTIGKDCSWSYW